MADEFDGKLWDEAMSGWRSDFKPAPAQLAVQRDRLLALVGREVTVVWTPLRTRDGWWCADGPIVLVFDCGLQLELSWQTWDDLSITWNTVDLTIPPVVFGASGRWSSAVPAQVAAIAGQTVTGFSITEEPYFSDIDLGDYVDRELPMDKVAGWMVTGLWIETGAVGLYVRNGIDANAVASCPPEPGPSVRMKPL